LQIVMTRRISDLFIIFYWDIFPAFSSSNIHLLGENIKGSYIYFFWVCVRVYRVLVI
jgi:hypothetical protein